MGCNFEQRGFWSEMISWSLFFLLGLTPVPVPYARGTMGIGWPYVPHGVEICFSLFGRASVFFCTRSLAIWPGVWLC